MEHIACARTRLEEGSFADQDQLLRTACSFIDQLRGTLTLHSGDPMTVNLDDLYDYVGRQLVLANSQDGLTTLDAVSHLLLEIRSAWQALPTQTHTPRPTAR